MKRDRNELLERRDELRKRMEAIQADLGRGLAADSEEQAIQLENLEVLQEIHRLAQRELEDIERELAALPDE